jgi:hypothetical protein
MAEPITVVGGVLLLLAMMSGKKKSKKKSIADVPGNLGGGGTDDKSSQGDSGAGVKSGGTNVGGGGGMDGSDYLPPPNLNADDLWISPDCRAVKPGATWYQNKFRPRVLQITSTWPTGQGGSRDWPPGINDVMAVAIGQFRFANTPEPLLHPSAMPSCLSDWPGWYWGTVYSRTSTEHHASKYNADLAAYNEAFPALGSYLNYLKQSLMDDPAVLKALLEAQEYSPNVLYFTGVDSSLYDPAAAYIMEIAGNRAHEKVDYDRLIKNYPESFPAGEALLVFMRRATSNTGFAFSFSTVPWSLRDGGPMTFAFNPQEQRDELAASAVDTVVNEVGWSEGVGPGQS